MQTKSKIQLIKEQIEQRDAFFKGLSNLMNDYLIEDSTFSFNGQTVTEHTNGYFNMTGEYETLEEAARNYNTGECVRIIENKTFQIGNVYSKMSEIKESKKIIDISTGSIVE